MGTLIPAEAGKNLPNSMLVATSICTSLERLRSDTFLSTEPKPYVLLLPESVTLAKSASCAFTRPIAAQPPASSKSVKRNSLNQICTHFGSSGTLEIFLTPTTIDRTFPKSGFPLIQTLFFPS